MNRSNRNSNTTIAAMLAVAGLAVIASCLLLSTQADAYSIGNGENGEDAAFPGSLASSSSSSSQRNKRALFGGPSGDSGLELCKIFKNKAALAAVDEVCHRCYELFRKENLHIQCRAKCYNNEIFEECARVVLQESLIEQRQKYL